MVIKTHKQIKPNTDLITKVLKGMSYLGADFPI